MAPDRVAELREPFEQFQDVLELSGGEDLAVREILQLHFVRAEADENLVQLRVVIHIFLALLALDEIKRRRAM